MMDNRSRHQASHPFEMIIPILRVVGVAMIIAGLSITFGFVTFLPVITGIFIAICGLIEFFAVPAILRKVVDNKRETALEGRKPQDAQGK